MMDLISWRSGEVMTDFVYWMSPVLRVEEHAGLEIKSNKNIEERTILYK
jgi:hypothetical protein